MTSARQALLEQRLRQAVSAIETGTATIPRRPESDPHPPLSFAQERIWFMEQYAPGTAAYNVPVALRLRGPLVVGAIGAALNRIVERHESLRMRFNAMEDGRPRITVLPSEPIQLAEMAVPEPQAHEIVAAAAIEPFNLETGPLLRATLIRLADDDHVLLLVVHHIAADGWSTDVLIGELAERYDAALTGVPPKTAALPIQYGDFAAWQRQRLAGPDTDVAYWREKLEGLPPLDLPTDRPRPAEQTFDGAGHAFFVDPRLNAAIGTLATRLGATPYMVILAAFEVLLWRHSGQRDFAVGSPVAGRLRPELEGIIGMFTNVLTLRADLTGNPTFADLVTRVRDTALDAYAHQELPFEQLVNELKLPRETSRSPLFQVALAMQNYSVPPAPQPFGPTPHRAQRQLTGGVDISWFVVEAGATRFDIEIYLYGYEAGLSGFLVYNRLLFEHDTIARLGERLLTLLSAGVAAPETHVTDLPLQSPAERARVIAAGRGVRAVLPDDANLVRMLAEQAAARPDAVALVFEGQPMTYAELDRRANQLAHTLIGQGVTPGSLVAISASRSHELVIGLLGILKAGAAYVPLDPDYPAERLSFMLSDSGAGVLLTQRDLEAGAAGTPCHAPDITVSPDLPAYVIYTSGSTGRPKGVVNTHRAIVNRLDWMQREFGLTRDDAVMQKTPAGFDVSVWEFFWPLLTGARLVLARPGGHRDPAYLRELIAAEQITTIHFVPSMLSAFLADLPEGFELPSLRRIVCSGEVLPPDVAQRCLELLPSVTLHNLYGPTEAAVDVSSWRCHPGEPTVPIGHPIQNVDLRVLDEGGRPQPIGVPGELYIGGVAVALGYLNRPALTVERFLPDPFGEPGSRLYRTGDQARLRADGSIEYLGRLDDQVKIRGVRVELGEIESVLRTQSGVDNAAVTVREGRLIAYVVGNPLDPGRLHADLRRALPDAMVPTVFMPLDALPLSPNGKLDRKALPAPEHHRGPSTTTAPQTPAEQLIASIWAHVLDRPDVGIDDDFFDLGGHSLLAVQVVAQLRRPLAGAGLAPASVMDLFRCPTVRILGEHVSRSPSATRLLHELTRPSRDTEHVRSFVCIPYGGGSAVVYQPLANALPAGQRLFALAMPGNDIGLAEEAQPLEAVVSGCVEEILEHVPGPVVVYGHCGVGNATAIALALALQAAGRTAEAVYIGASFPFARPAGRFAGALARVTDRERILSDKVFASWLTGMGVDLSDLDPDEVTAVVKAMRRDSTSAEDYLTALFAGTPPRLDAPVISVVGDRDPATDLYRERFTEWHALTTSTAVVALEEGGHYFVRYRAAELAEILTTTHVALSAGTLAENTHATWAVRGVSHSEQGHAERAAAGPQPGMPRFAAVAASQLVSMTGAALTEFAIPLWLYVQTGSLITFALMATIGLLPGLLVAPLAGAVVDRNDRRRVMLAADAVAGGTQAAMVLLWLTGNLGTAPVYAMLAILSIALTFQRLAYASAVAQLVPKRYLGHANGLVQTSNGIAQFVVPIVAVTALSVIGIGGILVIDALSYLVSIAVLGLLRFPNTLANTRRESLLTEIVTGMRYSLGHAGLRAMLLYFAILNVFLSPLLLLVSPLTLSFGDLATAGQVALLGGLGAALGGLAVSVWGGPRSERMKGMLVSAAVLGIFGVLTGLRPTFPTVALGVFGILFCLAVVNGIYATIVQVKVPQRFHGRVFALNTVVAWSTIPLGFAVVAPLGTRMLEPLLAPGGPLAGSVGAVIGVGEGRGIALMYVLFGLMMLALSLAALRLPTLGRFDRLTPDAIPDDLVGLETLRAQEEPCSTTPRPSSSS